VFREVTGAALEGEAFRECLDVNVGGVVNALVPLVPAMRARGRGQIALMASAAARTGWPTTAAYGAANAAVVTMAEALRLDLAPAGIHVTVVAPGFVDTPLSRRTSLPKPGLMSVDEAAERIVEGLGRPGFEIAFPRRLTWPLKLLNLVPYRLYFPLLNRLARRGPVMVTGARRR